MGRIIKYIFGITILLIALLIAAPFFISIESYKNTISYHAKKHTGRDLNIDGKISLNLFPMPEVKLRNVSMSSIKGAKYKNLFEAKNMLARLEFMPLLKGELVISSIELVGPVIKLEKLKNGKSSWEFEVSKNDKVEEYNISKASNKASENKQEPVAQKEKLPISINNISISNGNLSYIDPENNIRVKNFDIKISLKDLYDLPNASSNHKTAAKGRWPRDKIDLSILGIANASFDFKAKNIIASEYEVDNFILKSTLNENTLKINNLSGEILGGKFSAMGNVSGKSDQKIDFKFDLKNAQIRDIAPEMNRIKITNGLVDFAININSKGMSIHDYVSNLQGSMNMVAKDGVISGINLEQITNALSKPTDIAALGKNLSLAIGKGQTPFNSIMNDVKIERGIASINRCELVSANTSAFMEGRVNLLAFTMDTYATLNSGINNIPPIRVRLYGAIDNMQHEIDVRSIWKHLVKHSLTGAISNITKGKGLKPKDLLKGIVGSEASPENKNSSEKREGDVAGKLIQKGLKGLFK